MLAQSPVGGTERPLPHVVERGRRGRRRRRRAPRLDDRGAALLHGRDEVVLDPRLIDEVARGLAVDLRVEQVGVLGRGVVAPDRHVGDGRDLHTRLRRDLRLGAVVVEARHRGEALARDRTRVVHRDETVRVGGVADHEDAHVGGRARRERLALRGEDRAVRLEQLLALHALGARPRTDEQRVVDALERLRRVVAGLDAVQQRERAVLELHHDAVQRAERGRDLEHRQDDRLVGAEQITACDAEDEAVTDLTGGAGHCDSNGVFHGAEASRR